MHLKHLLVALLSVTVTAVSAKTINVASVQQLNAALSSVEAGDVIQLADGRYTGAFTATRSGRSGAQITLQGSKNAVLSGSLYGFWLKANYWTLKGFSVTSSLKGIMVDGGNHNILDGLEVSNIRQEGIHFRLNSADNILRNSYIHDTGKTSPGYGEGVYIGSAVSNWQGGPDRSDRNQILNNRIGPNVAAECVDIKEGSSGGIVRGNTFTGPQSGQNSADSWVDIKGTGYTIEGNTGTRPLKDGIQIHRISAGGANSGCNNVVQNNKCNQLPAGGKCVADESRCSNTIRNN